MKRSAWTAVVLTLALSACWTQYRGDYGHTGNQLGETKISRANVASLVKAWTLQMPGGGSAGTPAIASGTAWAVGPSGLAAFDAKGGTNCDAGTKICSPLWSRTPPTGQIFVGTPALADAKVYVQSTRGISVFDTIGTLLWVSSDLGVTSGSPAAVSGTVYVSGPDRLNAFDAAGVSNCSGSPKVCGPVWQSQPYQVASSAAADSAPTVANGRVYVSDGAWLYAYDAAGVPPGCTNATTRICPALWRAANAQTSPLAYYNDLFVYGGTVGVSALDGTGSGCVGNPVTCSAKWTGGAATSSSSQVPPPAYASGNLFQSAKGNLMAFDGAGINGCNGSPKVCNPLWAGTRASAETFTSAPTTANGVLYVVTTENAVQKLKTFDVGGTTGCSGAPKMCGSISSFTLPGGASSLAPIAVVEGTVYIGTSVGVVALKLPTTTTMTPLSAIPTPQLPNVSDPSVATLNADYFVYGSNTLKRAPVTKIQNLSTVLLLPAKDAVTTDAMPDQPAWVVPGTLTDSPFWAPTVGNFASRSTKPWVMYFAGLAKVPPYAAPNDHCVGRAVADSPQGPFTPDANFFYCGGFTYAPTAVTKGAIDPELFTDPSGQKWLLVAVGNTENSLYTMKLDAQGNLVAGTPGVVLNSRQPWEGTKYREQPAMVFDTVRSNYLLAYSVGNWWTAGYSTGLAHCDTPAGPCTSEQSGPWVASSNGRTGPGALSFFTDTAGQVNVIFASFVAGSEGTCGCDSPRSASVMSLDLSDVSLHPR